MFTSLDLLARQPGYSFLAPGTRSNSILALGHLSEPQLSDGVGVSLPL